MKKITALFLFLIIALSAPAQNPFEFKGKIFAHASAGYRAPLKKYFRGTLLDDMISLKNNSVVIGITHYYFFRNKWGVFLDMAFAPSRPKNRPESDLLRFARYKKDYYLNNNGGWSAAGNTDGRYSFGGTYRIEKNRWRFFALLGVGMTEFEAVEDIKRLKEKNSNVNYTAELIWNGRFNDPDFQTAFLTSAGLLSGYRLNKRFTAVANVKLSHFATHFEYRLQRTNQYTKEYFIDDIYSYKRGAIDITASMGIMFTPDADRRFRK